MTWRLRGAERRISILMVVGALALLGPMPAVALALRTRVTEKVTPKVVSVHHRFSTMASGDAARRVTLWQFLDFTMCARTERQEARRHVPRTHDPVRGLFSVGPLSASASRAGGDHACAYLVRGGRTLARSVATFRVVR